MRLIPPTLVLSLLLSPCAVVAQSTGDRQLEAAATLLSVLDTGEADSVLHPWSSDDRREWSYFPWGHAGLPLSAMTGSEVTAAMALLDSALSEDGRRRARQVMDLEADEARKGFISRLWTDGQAYYTSVFGAPQRDTPWAWRFEGHHLSVNITLAAGAVRSGTPYFIGADPAVVSAGRLAGLRILEREETLARALFLSLDDAQRARALVAEKAPRDILTGSEARAELACCEGIPYPALDPSQQEELLVLVDIVAGQLHPEIAALHLDRMRAAGTEKLHFAWAGSERPGEGHYYRIQGPTLLIEYDNTQNDANHIHLVLRDPARDFGGDPLQAHYATAEH